MAMTTELLKQRFPQLLGELDHTEAQILLDSLIRIEATPGEVLVRAGDYADSLHLIWEGRVNFFKEVAGREIALGSLGPGGFFGTEVVVDPAPEVGTSRAAEPVVLLRLNHAQLEKFGETHPRLASKLLRVLSFDMMEWLHTFEEYMTKRTLPNDLEECIKMIQELRELGKV